MGIIMQPKEVCGGSTREMERAFRNILAEIIEHAIEGLCFEAHRAIKLGYFTEKEYILKDRKFENYQELSEPEGAIFATKKEVVVFATCSNCGQEKAATVLSRHMKHCKKTKDNSTLVNSGKTENSENNVEGNHSDGKKLNDAKRQVKSTQNYKTMSLGDIQRFLKKHCGVIRANGQPCKNSLNCSNHSKEDRDKVRISFESLAEPLTDGNIDIDTVD